MTTSGAKITRKEKAAIAALLSTQTIEAAATAAKISEKTLRRWLKKESFKAAYDAAARECVDAAIKKLQASMQASVDELVRMLKARETKFFQNLGKVIDKRDVIAWGPRLGAAKTLLEMGLRAVEISDLEKRVTDLEKALKAQGMKK